MVRSNFAIASKFQCGDLFDVVFISKYVFELALNGIAISQFFFCVCVCALVFIFAYKMQ